MPPVRSNYEEQPAAGEQHSRNDHSEPTRRENDAVPGMRLLHFRERSGNDPDSRDQKKQERHFRDPHARTMREREKAHVEAMLAR